MDHGGHGIETDAMSTASTASEGGRKLNTIRHRTATLALTTSLFELAAAEKAKKPLMAGITADALNEVFGIRGYSASAPKERRTSARDVLFLGITAVATDSSAPVVIAVDFPKVTNGLYYDTAGKRSALHVHRGTDFSHRTVLAEIDQSSSKFIDSFPGYTANNVGTMGITQLAKNTNVLVRRDHPVIAMIEDSAAAEENAGVASELTSMLGEDKLVMGEYFPISKPLVDRALEAIHNEVTSKLPTRDISEGFLMKIHRADGRASNDAVGVIDMSVDKNLSPEELLHQRFTVSVTLRLSFELPTA